MRHSTHWPILLLLLSFQAARAADPPDNASKPTPEQNKAQLQRIQSRIHQLEAQMYAHNPDLKQVEEDYKQLLKKYAASEGNQGAMVSKYLQSEDRKRGDQAATKAYHDLYSEWSGIAGIDAMKDPKIEKVWKDLVTAEPRMMKRISQDLKKADPSTAHLDLDDPDQLWPAFKAALLKDESHERERIKKMEEKSDFPQYVLDFARKAGIGKFLSDDVYFAYIQLNLPQELKDARMEESHLLQALQPPSRK